MIFWLLVYAVVSLVWWFARAVLVLAGLMAWVALSVGAWFVLKVKGDKA